MNSVWQVVVVEFGGSSVDNFTPRSLSPFFGADLDSFIKPNVGNVIGVQPDDDFVNGGNILLQGLLFRLDVIRQGITWVVVLEEFGERRWYNSTKVDAITESLFEVGKDGDNRFNFAVAGVLWVAQVLSVVVANLLSETVNTAEDDAVDRSQIVLGNVINSHWFQLLKRFPRKHLDDVFVGNWSWVASNEIFKASSTRICHNDCGVSTFVGHFEDGKQIVNADIKQWVANANSE